MIAHVIEKAVLSGVGDVYVACSEQAVYDATLAHGARAIMTRPEHVSGTDRIHEALSVVGSEHEYIVNLQGDLPTLDPALIRTVLQILQENPQVDIATLACPIHTQEERDNPNIVKPVISFSERTDRGRALYFSRACVPYGHGAVYHHIGIYAYRKSALRTFVSLPQSGLEKRESLEQLRALEHAMRIDVGIVDTMPLGVDTPADLEIARNLLKI